MEFDVAAARQIGERWGASEDFVGCSTAGNLLLQTCSEVDRLRDERRWIPVSERLPPLMTEVLGWHKDDRVRAWFRHSGQPKDAPYWELWSPQDRECDDCEVDQPTHWQPLPPPPAR